MQKPLSAQFDFFVLFSLFSFCFLGTSVQLAALSTPLQSIPLQQNHPGFHRANIWRLPCEKQTGERLLTLPQLLGRKTPLVLAQLLGWALQRVGWWELTDLWVHPFFHRYFPEKSGLFTQACLPPCLPLCQPIARGLSQPSHKEERARGQLVVGTPWGNTSSLVQLLPRSNFFHELPRLVCSFFFFFFFPFFYFFWVAIL